MSKEDKTINLMKSLCNLVSSFNAVLDRLDTLADRNEELCESHQELIRQNQEVFKLAREDFFRRLIEAEVNKYTLKNQQQDSRRIHFGSDIVRKAKKP